MYNHENVVVKNEGGLIDSITKLLTRFHAETGQDVSSEINQIQVKRNSPLLIVPNIVIVPDLAQENRRTVGIVGPRSDDRRRHSVAVAPVDGGTDEESGESRRRAAVEIGDAGNRRQGAPQRVNTVLIYHWWLFGVARDLFRYNFDRFVGFGVTDSHWFINRPIGLRKC